ncbi:MAG: hypothetical protein WCL06_14845, partial [Bacteroidota bacterium]
MKTFIKSSIFLGLFLVLTSFSWTNDNLKKNYDRNQISTELLIPKDEVIITYDNSDVCGLKSLGEVKVTEKWWFYNNNDLKTETITELKKQASEKGGNIVFVNIKEKKGFGLFFSTTIIGYIYK